MSNQEPQTRAFSEKKDAIADVKGDLRELSTDIIIEKLKQMPKGFKLAKSAFMKELYFRADRRNDVAAKQYTDQQGVRPDGI